MASLTHGYAFEQFSGSWWYTGKPGVLQSIGPQRVRHNWELNWTDAKEVHVVDTLNQFYQITIFLLALSVTERSMIKYQPCFGDLHLFSLLSVTYFKSLLVVYIFIFFTLPSLIEHLNYEMPLYEQNFLLRFFFVFWWLLSHKSLGFLGIFMIQVSPTCWGSASAESRDILRMNGIDEWKNDTGRPSFGEQGP